MVVDYCLLLGHRIALMVLGWLRSEWRSMRCEWVAHGWYKVGVSGRPRRFSGVGRTESPKRVCGGKGPYTRWGGVDTERTGYLGPRRNLES